MVFSMNNKPAPFNLGLWLQNHNIPSVDTIFSGGYNTLHLAAFHCDYHAVVALVAYRDTFPYLNIDSQADNGFTPLMAACCNIHTPVSQKESVLRSLVKKLGANPMVRTKCGQNLVPFAMRAGVSAKCLLWLLEKCKIPIDCCPPGYASLIAFASSLNCVDYFDVICKKTIISMTRLRECISIAAARGSLNIFKRIAKQHPSLIYTLALPNNNPLAPNKATLFHIACGANQWQICKYLIKKAPQLLTRPDGEGDLPIMYAARAGCLEIVQALFDVDPSIVAYCNPMTGDSALHVACRHAHLAVVNLLVSLRASITALNIAQDTPLHCLVSFNKIRWSQKEVLAYKRTMAKLVDPSVDPSSSVYFVVNAEGNTPFLAAAQARNQVAMEFLTIDLPVLVYEHQRDTTFLPFVKMAGYDSIQLTAIETGDSVRSRPYKFIFRRRSSSLNLSVPKPYQHSSAREVDVAALQKITVSDISSAQDGMSSLDAASSGDGDYGQSFHGPRHGEKAHEYIFRFGRFVADQCNPITYQYAPHLALSNRGRHRYAAIPALLRFMYETLGCKMHLQDLEGNTPFLEACRNGNLPCVLWLTHYAGVEASPFLTNHFQASAFMLTCASGNLELLKWMMSQIGGDPRMLYQLMQQQDCSGQTPVMAAALMGRLPLLQSLASMSQMLDRYIVVGHLSIKSKTKPVTGDCWRSLLSGQACKKNGRTALLLAAQEGHLHVVEWIVSQLGVSSCLAAADKRGKGLVYYANHSRDASLIDYCAKLTASL